MSELNSIEKMPSPILMIGDDSLCKKNIVLGKQKYTDAQWIEMSFKDYSVDQIRGESSSLNFFMQKKVIVLKDIPNQKAIRSFIINLVSSQQNVKFIIWDSLNNIKPDPKKGTFNATWSKWIDEIKNLDSSKFINNGFVTSNDKDSISYIQSLFTKKRINCDYDTARLLQQIAGKNRGVLNSEVNKISLTVSGKVSKEDILSLAYPITQEAVIYQLGNALDSNNLAQIISTLEDFLSKKVHPNVLAEILMKRARWQLIVIDMWVRGIAWSQIERDLMGMGSFPASLSFEDSVKLADRKKIKKELSEPVNAKEFMVTKMGLPDYYFDRLNGKDAKLKRSESLPMPFIATQTTNYVKDVIIMPSASKVGIEQTRKESLDKGMKTYLNVSEGFKRIRYGYDVKEELYNMIRELTVY